MSEMDVMEILKKFDNVEKVWKDCQNSKIDIYYILKGETYTRGLQLKTLSNPRLEDNNSFYMHGLNKYDDGILIVGINKLHSVGLAYLHNDSYKVKATCVTITDNPKTELSKMLLKWDDFVLHLYNILQYSLIITKENHKNFLTKYSYLEYESIERFYILCKNFGLNVMRVEDNSSPTDLTINGFKVQMKFVSNPEKGREYRVFLTRQKSEPYKQGDNDFYIIEIGSKIGEFLILSEEVLISNGFITTIDRIGKQKIHVYPYDYTENLNEKEIGPKIENFGYLMNMDV
jgi:hypothetical protein